MAATVVNSCQYYFKTLTQILGQPRYFFRQLPPDTGVKKALGFLLTSSVLYSLFTIISFPIDKPIIQFLIYLVNAVGMCLITSAILYISLTMAFGKRAGFLQIFNILALSTGVTLLASWLPHFSWLVEPWKWWLVCVGLVHGCHLRWWKTILTVGLTVSILTLLFLMVLPLFLKG